MGTFLAILLAILGGLMLVFAFSFILAVPVMLLWNFVMPDLFGLAVIGYWKAWGLMLLCSLLFKGSSSSSSKK